MNSIEVSLLGVLEVAVNNQPIKTFATSRAQALLAYLAVEATQRVTLHIPRNQLATLFWPSHTDQNARKALRQTLYLLKQALPNADALLSSTRDMIGWKSADLIRVDWDIFCTTLDRVARHNHASVATCAVCCARLEEAVALYRDGLLTGFPAVDSAAYERWLTTRKTWLTTQMRDALQTLVQHYTHLGNLTVAVAYAEKLVALDPLEEDAQRLLIETLAQSGQRGAALAQFERARLLFQQELGSDFSAEIPPPHTSSIILSISTLPTTLPIPINPLITNDNTTTNQINDLVQQPACRLLTIYGLAGSGKSALTAAVAHDNVIRYRDGVQWITIDPAGEPIADQLCAHFNLAHAPFQSTQQQIQAFLRQRHLLLVVDGCQQRTPELTQTLLGILQAAPQVQIIVTSRQRLNIIGEWTYLVEGAQAGTEIFCHYAQQAHGAFAPSVADRAKIDVYCQQTGNHPLAIQQVAASLRFFNLPTALQRSVETHADLMNELGKTWRTFSVGTRRLAHALPLFGCTFTWNALVTVADATMSALTELLDCAWVSQDVAGVYSLPPLIGRFLAIHTKPSPSVRQRHADFYLSVLQSAESALCDHRQPDATRQLSATWKNVVRAWRSDPEQGANAASALTRFCDMTGRYQIGAELLALTAEKVSSPHAVRCHQAWLLFLNGDAERAYALFNRYLPHCQNAIHHTRYVTLTTAIGDDALAAKSVQQLIDLPSHSLLESGHVLRVGGELAYHNGQFAKAQLSFERGLAMRRVQGDLWGMALLHAGAGQVAHATHKHDEAQFHFTQATRLYEQVGDLPRQAALQLQLAEIAQQASLLNRAVTHLRAALQTFKQLDQASGMAQAHLQLGRILRKQSQSHAALAEWHSALQVAVSAQLQTSMETILREIGRLLHKSDGNLWCEMPKSEWRVELLVAEFERVVRFSADWHAEIPALVRSTIK